MISFDEAQALHEGLLYDRVVTFEPVQEGAPSEIIPLIEEAIGQLMKPPQLIVLPWGYTKVLAGQWEKDPRIKTVRDTQAWLWGSRLVFDSVDVFSTDLVECAWVLSTRNLCQEIPSTSLVKFRLREPLWLSLHRMSL